MHKLIGTPTYDRGDCIAPRTQSRSMAERPWDGRSARAFRVRLYRSRAWLWIGAAGPAFACLIGLAAVLWGMP